MSSLYRKHLILAAAVAASALLTSPASARPTSIRGLADQEVQLAAIAYRIGAASAASCSNPEMMTGVIVHDLTRYDPQVRPAVTRAFSLGTGFGVLETVPDSVGARAGLQVDDEIVAVGGVSVEDASAVNARQSYQRTERFQAVMQAALVKGHTTLLVRRGGSLLQLQLRGERGCGGRLALASSSTMNAWSDGRQVVVTTGMTSLARSNDEIAFVIAHEMAHNILGHSRGGPNKRAIFGNPSRMKGIESQADSYAVHLMSMAGYQPAGGLSFLSNASRRLWWNISLDHPGFGRRMRVVAAAMQQEQTVQMARRAGEQATGSSLILAMNAAQDRKRVEAKVQLANMNSGAPIFSRRAAYPSYRLMLQP